MQQYNTEPHSALTLQQTVALSVGYNLLASNVVITSVTPNPSVATGIIIKYTASSSAVQFVSSAAAFAALSNALKASISTGAFSFYLTAQAKTNAAMFLSSSSVIPQQAVIQNLLTSPPTLSPTLSPSYQPGRTTPLPSVIPTSSPTQRPSSSPSYGAGKPTSAPTLAPTMFGDLVVGQVTHTYCILVFLKICWKFHMIIVLISFFFLSCY